LAFSFAKEINGLNEQWQFGNHVLLNTCWQFGILLLLSAYVYDRTYIGPQYNKNLAMKEYQIANIFLAKENAK
jgi:hypothetical protein